MQDNIIDVISGEGGNYSDLSHSEKELYNKGVVGGFTVTNTPHNTLSDYTMNYYKRQLKNYIRLGLIGMNNENGTQSNAQLNKKHLKRLDEELVRINNLC